LAFDPFGLGGEVCGVLFGVDLVEVEAGFVVASAALANKEFVPVAA
jgi:hypothetical protein